MKISLEAGALFGRWAVRGEVAPYRAPNGNPYRQYECQCKCGTIRAVRLIELMRGTTRSCGCLSREIAEITHLRHGNVVDNRKTPEYRAWGLMKSRCYNRRNSAWGNYGGRGIAVCSEWINDFQAFLDYVGPRPSTSHSIDRYPNLNGNYEPGNVRWATRREQTRNTRRTILITFQGRTQCAKDWAEEVGISPGTLRWRLAHWPLEDALSSRRKVA